MATNPDLAPPPSAEEQEYYNTPVEEAEIPASDAPEQHAGEDEGEDEGEEDFGNLFEEFLSDEENPEAGEDLSDVEDGIASYIAQPTEAGTPSENPFEEPVEGSPFDDIVPVENVQSNVPTTIRTMVMALANADVENAKGEDEVLTMMEAAIDQARGIIENNQEASEQFKAAVKLIQQRDKTLKALPGIEPVVTPELAEEFRKTTEENIRQDIAKKARAALEEVALQNAVTAYRSGDRVAMQTYINSLRPERNSTLGVIIEEQKGMLVLQSAIERATQDVEEQGVLSKIMSFVLWIPNVLLLGSARSKIGNFTGPNGEEYSMLDVLFPGGQHMQEIAAWQAMSAEEKAERAPQLIENVKNNSTYAWLVEDPTRVEHILTNFQNGITNHAANVETAWAWVDAVSIFPWVSAGRVTRHLVTMGGRRAAADNVAAAAETMVREGAEAAARRTGVTPDEIIDESLPTNINPTIGPPAPRRTNGGVPTENVSLSGEISETYLEAQRIADEIRGLHSSGRLSPEELTKAIEAKLAEASRVFGVDITDLRKVEVPLPNGSAVTRLEFTLNKPFATAAEALSFIKKHGFETDETMAFWKDPTTRNVTPRDEGFTYNVFRGTNTDAANPLAASTSGKMGQGLYVTPDPDLAKYYAGKGPNAKTHDLLIRPEKIFGLAQMGGWTVADIQNAWKSLGLRGKQSTALKNELVARAEANGGRIADGGEVLDALGRAAPKGKTFLGNDADALNALLRKRGYEGAAARFGNDQEILLFDEAMARQADEVNVVQDASGAFFPRVTADVSETGFWTSPLNPPRQSVLSRFLLNTSQTSDRRLFEQATASGQRATRYLKQIQQNLTKAFGKLNSTERTYLDQVLIQGDRQSKWFTQTEFNTLWERATGKLPSENVTKAYHQYRVNNDLEHIIRDADLYTQKVIKGYQSARLNVQGESLDIDVIPSFGREQPFGSKDRVFNASENVHYNKRNPLDKEGVDRLTSQGYVFLKTERPVKLADGTKTNVIAIKRGELEIRPLRRNQLGYKAGGHRLYADKYFVKQTVRGRQPDTGEEFLENPNVLVTAPNIRQAREWADVMERARLAVKDGEGAAFLDENIFNVGSKMKFPTGEEFIDDIEKGRISKDEPFEPVFDREMPKAYQGNPDAMAFVDEDEIGFGGFYRTTGRMYYSPKGTALKSVEGDWAPTLDPFQAQSVALSNVSRLSSFSDFKMTAMERWSNTYRQYLTNPDPTSAINTFNHGVVDKSKVRGTLLAQMEGQRAHIRSVLGHETAYDRFYRDSMRSLSEWIAEKGGQKTANAPFWLLDHNPVNFLRGIAFDMKLGMFNPGQLFLQTSTIVAAIGLSPKAGLKGFASIVPMRAYLLSRNGEGVLETLTSRGVHKLLGFGSAEEMKIYARNLKDGGFLDVGNTQQLVNNTDAHSTFSMGSKVEAVREKGRIFFYEAEVYNRIVAHRIAYEEAVQRFGKTDFNSREFREYIAGRAENYAFNMSSTSKAAWQSGVLSVPTQFWAYNVRMLEAMVGKNFTLRQKMGLLASQLGLAGTGGIPILAALSDWQNNANGKAPDIDTWFGTSQRGLADRLAYEMFGADMQLGARWGTGDFWTEMMHKVMGRSAYGPVTVADFAGGATYSIFGETLGAAFQVANFWTAHESGGEEPDLSAEEWIKLGRQISTLNNSYKAYIAFNFGFYQSTKGSIVVDNMPQADAFFIALGFAPGELTDMTAMRAYGENRKEVIDEQAKLINNLLAEGVQRPDLYVDNARKVSALMALLPDDIKREVLQRVDRTRDPSVYSSMVRKREAEELRKSIRSSWDRKVEAGN